MASEDEGAEPDGRCEGGSDAEVWWAARQAGAEQGDGPGAEGHRGAKPWEPSNRPNWENEDLTPG